MQLERGSMQGLPTNSHALDILKIGLWYQCQKIRCTTAAAVLMRLLLPTSGAGLHHDSSSRSGGDGAAA